MNATLGVVVIGLVVMVVALAVLLRIDRAKLARREAARQQRRLVEAADPWDDLVWNFMAAQWRAMELGPPENFRPIKLTVDEVCAGALGFQGRATLEVRERVARILRAHGMERRRADGDRMVWVLKMRPDILPQDDADGLEVA